MKVIFSIFFVLIFSICKCFAQELIPIATACPRGGSWKDFYYGVNSTYSFYNVKTKMTEHNVFIKDDSEIVFKKINDTIFQIRPLIIGEKKLIVKGNSILDTITFNAKYCPIIFSTVPNHSQYKIGFANYKVKGLFIVNDVRLCDSCSFNFKILEYDLVVKRKGATIKRISVKNTNQSYQASSIEKLLFADDLLYASNVKIRTNLGIEYIIDEQLINKLLMTTISK